MICLVLPINSAGNEPSNRRQKRRMDLMHGFMRRTLYSRYLKLLEELLAGITKRMKSIG